MSSICTALYSLCLRPQTLFYISYTTLYILYMVYFFFSTYCISKVQGLSTQSCLAFSISSPRWHSPSGETSPSLFIILPIPVIPIVLSCFIQCSLLCSTIMPFLIRTSLDSVRSTYSLAPSRTLHNKNNSKIFLLQSCVLTRKNSSSRLVCYAM